MFKPLEFSTKLQELKTQKKKVETFSTTNCKATEASHLIVLTYILINHQPYYWFLLKWDLLGLVFKINFLKPFMVATIYFLVVIIIINEMNIMYKMGEARWLDVLWREAHCRSLHLENPIGLYCNHYFLCKIFVLWTIFGGDLMWYWPCTVLILFRSFPVCGLVWCRQACGEDEEVWRRLWESFHTVPVTAWSCKGLQQEISQVTSTMCHKNLIEFMQFTTRMCL